MTSTELERCDLPIAGMSCASCAAHIEKALDARPGVENAAVNFASKRATVTYDPHAVHRGELVQTVTDLGYSVLDAAPVDPEAGELRELRPRLAASIVLTIPVLLISMVPPLMFDGWQWVAFVLSTPVILWAGWPFHRYALAALRNGTTTMDTLVSIGTLAAYAWSVVALLFLGAAEHTGGMSFGALPRGRRRDPRLLRDRRRHHHPAAARPILRGTSAPTLEPRIARAARARREDGAARERRRGPGDEPRRRRPIRRSPWREDRNRRPRGRRRVRGRRLDAHGRARSCRRRRGRRRVRSDDQHVGPAGRRGDEGRQRHCARADRAARRGGTGLEGAGAAARRPGLGGLRARRARVGVC